MKRTNCCVVVWSCSIATLWAGQFVLANPLSDFDGGSLDGWVGIADPRSGDAFHGFLSLEGAGGNPGGFMKMRDVTRDGGGLVAANSADFQGDLTGYVELRWDEFLYSSPSVSKSTRAYLIGSDDTVYESAGDSGPLGPEGVWYSRSATLSEVDWTLASGSMSFEDVLADARIAFNMDVSTAQVPNNESGIDNIYLVPEPTSLVLLAFAGASVWIRRR